MQAFFQYGFNLPTEGSPPDLSRVDDAHFTAEHIYGALAHADPVPFEGGRGAGLGGWHSGVVHACMCVRVC